MVRPNQFLHLSTGSEPARHTGPRTALRAGVPETITQDDARYGELQMVSPDGQFTHTLDWQSEKPVQLLRNLMRLTAPNPGMMTGPGTNSYLVGDAQTGYLVVDPGPDEPAHIERLWQASGGDIRMIVCTHSHSDHSPGARPLQLLCRQKSSGLTPPILGRPSAATARAGNEFTPDRALTDQELLQLAAAATTHTLKVIHTPGHAANHLCLVLQEDGLLFSGDHVLNGSTTVIDPPDGNMSDYLDSLDRLGAVCSQHRVEFILPAHGHVLGQPAQAIAGLKAHRLQREAKIANAMRALPDGSMDDWVALAYDDVPPRLWPVAKRSMLAHVQRIQAGDSRLAS